MRAARYSALLTLGQFSVFIAQPWWFHRASSWIISCKFINLTNTINLSHSQRALGIEGLLGTQATTLRKICSNSRVRLRWIKIKVPLGPKEATHQALPLLATTTSPGAHRARKDVPQERQNASMALATSLRLSLTANHLNLALSR